MCIIRTFLCSKIWFCVATLRINTDLFYFMCSRISILQNLGRTGDTEDNILT